MILKDDHRAKVESTEDLIIKTFKPGYELSPYLFSDEWKERVNQFGSLYGHFPKIIEVSIKKMVMEKIEGKSYNDLRQESWLHLNYRRDMEQQFKDFRKMQFLYYRFISNLLEFNLKYNVSLIHNDLNYNNMLVSNNKLVCIDMDAVKLNRNPAENSFISLPIPVFQHDTETLNHKYHAMLNEGHTEANKAHRKQIEKQDAIIKRLRK